MDIPTFATWILKLHKKTRRVINGFTLVELLVVIGMLGILMLSLILTFNPLAQINKAQDSTRQQNLEQIQRALDTYYNDTGCYPTSLSFGSTWKSSTGQIYMQTVPQDPQCSADPSKCYVYTTDTTSTCPQWNVLFGAFRGSTSLQNSCPLSSKSSSCLPSGYAASGYNFCLLSGNVDCSVVSSTTIGGGGTGGSGGSGGTGGSGGSGSGSPTPTPTPGVLVCPGSLYYACTGLNNMSCNSEGIYPPPPTPGGVPTSCKGYGGTLDCVCSSNCIGLPCAVTPTP